MKYFLKHVLKLAVIIVMLHVVETQQNIDCPSFCMCFPTMINCEGDDKELTSQEELESLEKNVSHPERVGVMMLMHQTFEEIDLCKLKAYTNLRRLQITYSKLNRIPRNISNCLPNVKEVILSSNNINEIGKTDLLMYQNVKKLDLSKNKIKTIPGRVFKTMNSLLDLHLQGNGIKELTFESFYGLNDVRTLDLSDNQLEYIPNNVFPRIKALGALRLNRNNITDIANKAFKGLEVMKLELSGNKATTLYRTTFINSTIHAISINDNNLECTCDNLLLLVKTVSLIDGNCKSSSQVESQQINEVIRNEVDPCQKSNLCNNDKVKISILRKHLKQPINKTQNCQSKSAGRVMYNEKAVKNSKKQTFILSITVGVLVVVLGISTFIGYRYRKKYSGTALVTSDITISSYQDNNNDIKPDKFNINKNNAPVYVETLQHSTDKDVTLKNMRRKISKVVFGNLQLKNPNNNTNVFPVETPITNKVVDAIPLKKVGNLPPYRKKNIYTPPDIHQSIDEEEVCTEEENHKDKKGQLPSANPTSNDHPINGHKNKAYEKD